MADRARLARDAAIAAGLVTLAVIWVRLAVRPSSDLLNHYEFGQRFLAGTFLYAGGLNHPYLPTWAAAHALLAPIPTGLVSAALFPLGVIALALLVAMLDRLSRRALPVDDTVRFWVAAAAVALTGRFVIRDLLDGGPNLLLIALAWGALYAWSHQSPWRGAWLLAAAIALKLTAAIFLVALVARGRHGPVLRTVLCTVALFLLPAVWMGIDNYGRHVAYWATRVGSGVMAPDPSIGVLGPEPVRNLSLRAAAGRLLVGPETSPDSRAISVWVALGAILVVTAATAFAVWRLRLRHGLDETVAWAAVGALGLLISPITWRAHAVALLPACYLLMRAWASEGRLHRTGAIGLVAVAVPSLLLARGIAGEAVSEWSDQWSLTTGAIICLVMGVAAWPSRH